VVLVGVVACGAVLKPPEPSRRLNLHTSGSLFESDNGYVLAVLPEPDARFLRLDIRYPVGSIDDPPGKEGLAHLVEHLMFDVEIKRGDRKTSIGAELGRLALSWNAYTTADHTGYETVAREDALGELVELEVDRLSVGCGGLTPAIVAREREVVLNELRERQGASGAQLERAIHEAVYPAGHPYRAVDSVETVAKLDFKDVCDFLAGPYRRGKAILIASGDVTERELVQAANDHLKRLHARTPATRDIPGLEPRHETKRIKADVEEPTMLVTWPLPAASTRDARMLEMVWKYISAELEADGFTFKWGHSAFAYVLGGKAAPVLVVGATLASANKLDEGTDGVKRAIDAAIYTLGHETDDAAWKETWQASAESLLARWESLGTRNEMLADMLDAGERDASLISRVDELVKATPDGVRHLAQNWLDLSRARYLLIEPSGNPSGVGRHAYAGGAEEHPTIVDNAALADQKLAVPDLPRLQTIRYALGNGLRVIMWPHGSAPLVHGRLVIAAGSAHDPRGREGIAALVGASEVDDDALVFADRELATRVDELVENLAFELRLPGREVNDDHRTFLAGRLRKKRATERRTYARDLMTAIYGASHPYAHDQMTEASIGQIHRDLVMDWARDHVVASNATLVITGQFDADLVKKHVAYNADQVKAGQHTPPIEPATEIEEERRVPGITAKPSPTIELDVAFRGGLDLDRHYAARLVLERVLDSRLAELRGKRALTYGFSASYEPRHAGGLWFISGDADASRADEAATALLDVLAELRRDPETYRAAFVMARQKVMESLVIGSTSSAAMVERLAEMARFDLADDFYDHLAHDVANLTLADFHAFVVGELAASRQVFGAFGNKAPVDAAMRVAQSRAD